MTKKGRITSADFRKFKPTARVHGAFFSLSVAPDQGGPKCACVVSKKVSSKAPVRNLLKRRCRAITVPLLKNNGQSLAFVLYAKKEAARAEFPALKKDIADLLGRGLERGTIQHS